MMTMDDMKVTDMMSAADVNTTDMNAADMNTKKDVNILFCAIVSLTVLAHIFVALLSERGVELNIAVNLILSQSIILVPGLVFIVMKNKDTAVYSPFRVIKIGTVLLLILFTWCMIPLVTCANVFSQFFTTNEVMNVSGSVLELPIVPVVFVVGMVGPFIEEFIFRGLIYTGLKGRGERYIASALVSGLFFGLMHMNFNQFCYAFVLGIIFCIVNECLESTWASFVCHAVVNTQNVLVMFGMNYLMRNVTDMGIDELYSNASLADPAAIRPVLFIMFAVFIVLSVFGTAIATCILYGMCVIEGRVDRFNMVLRPKKYAKARAAMENTPDDNLEGGNDVNENVPDTAANTIGDDENTKKDKKMLYSWGYVAIFLCIFVMFLLDPLTKLLK